MKFSKLGASLAAAAFIAAGGTTTATADESGYCWFNSETGQSKCFATEAQLKESVEKKEPVASKNVSGAVAVTPRAQYLVAQLYKDLGYGGGYFQIFDSVACGTKVRGSGLPAEWNDEVSSVRVYGGCTVKLWENGGYRGASFGWIGSVAYVGDALDNKISSIQWKKS